MTDEILLAEAFDAAVHAALIAFKIDDNLKAGNASTDYIYADTIDDGSVPSAVTLGIRIVSLLRNKIERDRVMVVAQPSCSHMPIPKDVLPTKNGYFALQLRKDVAGRQSLTYYAPISFESRMTCKSS